MLGLHHKLSVGDARWDYFQKSLAIRNRITHPKTPEDLHFKEEEFDYIVYGLQWFVENLRDFRKEFFDKVEVANKMLDDFNKKDSASVEP